MDLMNRFLAAMGLSASMGGEERDPSGGHLVPANTSWSQILDYAAGSGDSWPLDFYQTGLGFSINRDVAVSYATLNRCVTLVSGGVAQLIAGGHLCVVDANGRRRESRRANRIVELLSTSPDGGLTPSHSFIEDAVADYCLDGNTLIVPGVSSDGLITRLRRMSAWDADITYTNDGMAVYRMVPADGPVRTEYAAARDVIHVRWPRLLRHGGSRTAARGGFALAPVVALRPALDIGLQGDRYIREWFRQGSRSRLHVDFPVPEGARELVPEHRIQLRDWVREYTRTREPLVTFGAKSSKIEDAPQDEEAKELREFQVQEVAKVFGVPAPLLGVDITDWGSGIEQLAKLFYRFGLRQHLDRFLAPFQTRLLRPGDRFWVDTTDLLRGDAEAIQKMVMALQGDAQRPPVATREELRGIAGLPADAAGEFPQANKNLTNSIFQSKNDPEMGWVGERNSAGRGSPF